MTQACWWQAVTPHPAIQSGRVDETLFTARLSRAAHEDGHSQYRDAELFFSRTYLTRTLRQMLLDVLRRTSGAGGQNPVVNLQSSFGGGKTHSLLAIDHLLRHPVESLRVPQVQSLVAEAGLSAPARCNVAVLPCASLNPLGHLAADGTPIRTLWGEMTHQLAAQTGNPGLFQLVAENDAQLVAPGEETLEAVLRQAGPCVILIDETLHYVDKSSDLEGAEGSLAKQTVAFLRELTEAVDSVPDSMLVVSLTASRMDQLSNQALGWLQRLERHVSRMAAAHTPIEGAEIHEIVRQRLFERVDADVAAQVAECYRALYAGRGGLAGDRQGQDYRRLIERSYPFHPELVTVLYERWGSKPTFQLTRGTLRFLALALQHLWDGRDATSPDLILPGDLSLGESHLRAFVREVAGEGAWETVMGSDIAAAHGGQPAKAQLIDQEVGGGSRLAESLATTILLYSLSGGENPYATRQEIRLASARPDVDEAQSNNILDKFRRRLFYFYFDDDKHLFRKEPNVLSLQHSYRTNLEQSPEVTAFINKTVEDKALGGDVGGSGFESVRFRPQQNSDVPDDEALKLVVLDFDYRVDGGELAEPARQFIVDVLTRRGQSLRQCQNRLIFCLADSESARLARDASCDYKSWQKIQTNSSDWERIGAAQQELVKEQLSDTLGSVQRGLVSAFGWAVVPVENPVTGQLDLQLVKLGAYAPGMKVAPMVWQRLADETGASQHILKSLTPDILLQRYGPRAWPESESWLTTATLWERFTRQVGLPILADRRVLLEALRLGQREGLLAIGHLRESNSPRDQRDSYLALFFEDANLPPHVPEVGERWLVLRPHMYHQIANQSVPVTAEDVLAALRELGGAGQPVSLPAVRRYVESLFAHGNLDLPSFRDAVQSLVQTSHISYRPDQDTDQTALPTEWDDAAGGFLSIPEGTTKTRERAAGRTVSVRGRLHSLNELAPLFQGVLKPLDSQSPQRFTISVDVTAEYDTDPGAGLDAALADGFDPAKFPGLTLADSRKPGSE